MPVDAGARTSGGYRLAAGSYANLLRNECDRRCGPDPRLLGEPDFDDLKTAGTARTAAMFDELLAAGEPIVVAAWQIPGRSPAIGAPDWLSKPAIHGGASMVRVHWDDVCEPAEFYGDMSGQLYERVPVPQKHRPANHA